MKKLLPILALVQILVTMPCHSQVSTNDPSLSEQWYLSKIRAQDAWTIASDPTTIQSDNIVIAVLDDGFDLDHPDINFWVNEDEIPNNGVDDDNNGYVDDVNGWDALDGDATIPSADHGTRVAGIIGAKANNGTGIAGLCWGVQILPIRVATSTPSSVVAGYRYALALKEKYFSTNGLSGAYVVATNLSQSLYMATPSEYPDWCAVYDELGPAGILNVCGPENRKDEIGGSGSNAMDDLPALCSSEYLIVVTATTPTDNLWEENNIVGAPWSQTYVDLAAPGENIYSTSEGDDYNYAPGTSFAAPLMAGTIALMYSAACDDWINGSKVDPAQIAREIKNKILNNSDPVGSLFLYVRKGRLNAYRALLAISEQRMLDRTLTGTLQQSRDVLAIQNIIVEDFTHTSENDLACLAGGSIILEPGVFLHPQGQGSAMFEISPTFFDCAIPYTPVSVTLATPSSAACDGMVFCNAAAYGGLAPYTFRWESRLTTSSTWTVHPQTSYLLVLNAYYDGDFYVRVRATDGNGTEAWSNTNLVACIDGYALQDGIDATIHGTNQTVSDGAESETLALFPNPVNEEFRLNYRGERTPVRVTVHDEQGRLVVAFPLASDGYTGQVEFRVPTTELAAGGYLLSVEFDGPSVWKRFVKLP